ncbi:type VII toxin-antitoxin system HepT family RNase toxin [Chlorobium limicola]
MDWSLIEQKIESLRRAVGRAEDHCPVDVETLARDYDAQDIVSVNLTRAVQICVDIANHVLSESDLPSPLTMGQSFDLLQELGVIDQELCVSMKKAVGFRNLAVHNYDTIDWAIVHAIARHHLCDFKAFARAVLCLR